MQLRPVRWPVLLTGLCLWLAAGSAAAAPITLSHNNSAVQWMPQYQSQQAYLVNWAVDGTNHLAVEQFYYRVGTTGPESDIGTLINSSNTTFFGTRGVESVYTDPSGNFSITISHLLTGGPAGSGQSLVAQEITIQNLSDGVLDFHFFQYADFDLNDEPFNDTAEVVNANTVRQTEGNLVIEETVVTPAPSHFEVDFFGNLFDSLNDSGPTTLADFGGPLGPSDLTWAFQWDVDLGAGDALLISKNLRIEVVPIPAAVWLFGSALGLLGWVRRKTT